MCTETLASNIITVRRHVEKCFTECVQTGTSAKCIRKCFTECVQTGTSAKCIRKLSLILNSMKSKYYNTHSKKANT